jgi:hypothetical protein
MSTMPLDEAALARAWDRAFSADAEGGSPIARFTVDTQSLANAGTTIQEGLIDTYQKLLTPWLNRLDETRPGELGALSFAAFDHAVPHHWNWPMRIELPPASGAAFAQRLHGLRGVQREFIEMVTPESGQADVVL